MSDLQTLLLHVEGMKKTDGAGKLSIDQELKRLQVMALLHLADELSKLPERLALPKSGG